MSSRPGQADTSLKLHELAWYPPRQDSNLGSRFRRPALFPLSYEGMWSRIDVLATRVTVYAAPVARPVAEPPFGISASIPALQLAHGEFGGLESPVLVVPAEAEPGQDAGIEQAHLDRKQPAVGESPTNKIAIEDLCIRGHEGRSVANVMVPPAGLEPAVFGFGIRCSVL